ncbi:DUF4345 domain-containing protein [Pseudomonas paraeruginosa]|uniref:DUF4345 domain-containing protein n=1 Tax=Pseudomonas aeruginosa group TaxID=136841 RepID=UPI00053ED944|nr:MULTISPECIES: DUF4345 domain-containing protein [Pseudomonas aeruginosa group]MBG4065716.1 DUF4345 domain-containing protein [Pseudomonas aeruginosa]MBG5598924.1 DUF4345 domain-containing protein [Pseudomonas aeruginosa]MBH3670885.1 DUF4345 domain-containing protein [Pseudomonas aeruginosa]MBH9432540.1 DUF4345 domain-containing protein [Pseudomonas aeruginosa]MBI8817887.1 DUF4345 domain-containing protein [Pseudomonas aeruginosa]
MTHPLRLLWLCSALFVVLGLGFVFFPGPLASLLTSGEPLTPAALTDLRASYGGTSLGVGLLLGYAALRPKYLVLGLLAALAVIASSGAARLYGVLIDASPALATFFWLAAEAVLCVLLLAALWKIRQLDLD